MGFIYFIFLLCIFGFICVICFIFGIMEKTFDCNSDSSRSSCSVGCLIWIILILFLMAL